MTCIAGLVHDGEVWMGADSAAMAGYDLFLRKDPKLFQRGEFVIGNTGSPRVAQLLCYNLDVEEQPDDIDDFQYMATLFVDAARSVLKAGGIARKNNEQETGGCFLVGYRGHLYEIDWDYQVCENMHPFGAVGCGRSPALGALDATRDLGMHPKDRILRALQAAERWNTGVRGPFILYAMTRNEDGEFEIKKVGGDLNE